MESEAMPRVEWFDGCTTDATFADNEAEQNFVTRDAAGCVVAVVRSDSVIHLRTADKPSASGLTSVLVQWRSWLLWDNFNDPDPAGAAAALEADGL
jgi:hypothetical protein